MIGATELAERLQRVQAALVPWRARGLVSNEIGGALLTHRPGAETGFPSSNPNAAYFIGVPNDSWDLIDRIIEHFGELGVGKFFVWLGPGANTTEIGESLGARGFVLWSWAEYPVLARRAEPLTDDSGDSGVSVRRVETAATAPTATEMGAIYAGSDGSGFFFRTLGNQAFDHFVAFADGQPMAAAISFVDGDVSYLGWATTRAEWRRRGAQRALIRARVSRAAERGCRWCISETVSVIPSSLANLKREGFEQVFGLTVYGWGIGEPPGNHSR